MHSESRNRSLLILMLPALAFVLLPSVVAACVLVPKPTVLDAYQEADVVIIARAISVEKRSDQSEKPMGILVSSTTMEVQKVFKGNLRVGDKMVFGQGNEIRCTWVFYEDAIGKEYLFYLDSPSTSDKLWYEYGLGRSNVLEHAVDDLLYLNNMDKVRGRTRISGVLDQDDIAGFNLEGQTIRVIGKHRTYVAKTDKNGVYELYDVPPGDYVLEPELKVGWKIDEFQLTRQPKRFAKMLHRHNNRVAFTLRPRRQFGVDIRLKLSNHVSGTVYDSASKPMPWVCVSLVPVGVESSLACNSLTDEKGRFRIDSVEAGAYLIILNYENKITPRMPFPKLYYPGVTEREKARAITLKHGESVNYLDFVIKK